MKLLAFILVLTGLLSSAHAQVSLDISDGSAFEQKYQLKIELPTPTTDEMLKPSFPLVCRTPMGANSLVCSHTCQHVKKPTATACIRSSTAPYFELVPDACKAQYPRPGMLCFPTSSFPYFEFKYIGFPGAEPKEEEIFKITCDVISAQFGLSCINDYGLPKGIGEIISQTIILEDDFIAPRYSKNPCHAALIKPGSVCIPTDTPPFYKIVDELEVEIRRPVRNPCATMIVPESVTCYPISEPPYFKTTEVIQNDDNKYFLDPCWYRTTPEGATCIATDSPPYFEIVWDNPLAQPLVPANPCQSMVVPYGFSCIPTESPPFYRLDRDKHFLIEILKSFDIEDIPEQDGDEDNLWSKWLDDEGAHRSEDVKDESATKTSERIRNRAVEYSDRLAKSVPLSKELRDDLSFRISVLVESQRNFSGLTDREDATRGPAGIFSTIEAYMLRKIRDELVDSAVDSAVDLAVDLAVDSAIWHGNLKLGLSLAEGYFELRISKLNIDLVQAEHHIHHQDKDRASEIRSELKYLKDKKVEAVKERKSYENGYDDEPAGNVPASKEGKKKVHEQRQIDMIVRDMVNVMDKEKIILPADTALDKYDDPNFNLNESGVPG